MEQSLNADESGKWEWRSPAGCPKTGEDGRVLGHDTGPISHDEKDWRLGLLNGWRRVEPSIAFAIKERALRAALTCPKVTSEKGEKSSKAFIAWTCARAEPHATSFAKPEDKKRLRKVNFWTIVACYLLDNNQTSHR